MNLPKLPPRLHAVMAAQFDVERSATEIASELSISHKAAAHRMTELRKLHYLRVVGRRPNWPKSQFIETFSAPTEEGFSYLGTYVYDTPPFR